MTPPADLADGLYPVLTETPAGGANFAVRRLTAGARQSLRHDSETFLLIPDGGVAIGDAAALEEPAVVILPAGETAVTVAAGARAYLLSPRRDRAPGDRPEVALPGAPDVRREPRTAPWVLPIADWHASPERPRLKMLQTDLMSINWVDYAGARDRTQLSPHAHGDFEQGSLAIDGDFVHHLRTPWGSNADLWRADAHVVAGPDTLIVVPPKVIHTTEGIGDGRHLLIDVFCPPRRDFIANGWVANAADYAADETVAS